MLELALLGPPAVVVGGRPVAFDTRKATALLAYLAVEGRPQPRDRVAALLWPDADPARARSALRRTVSVTAAKVGDALVVDRAHLALADSRVSCDVIELRRLAARDDLASLRRAAEQHRDEFLAGFALRDSPEFDEWQAAVATDLRRVLATVLSRLAQAEVARGDLDAATATTERWLALDQLHEPAHRLLMQLHAWRGDRAAAIRQYRRCAHILDTELGVAPLDETRALYDAVRRNAVSPPDVRTPSAPPVAAPRAGDGRLVGRDAEVAVIRQAVTAASSGHGGVVAVTGATGAGKTALLREAAGAATAGTTVVAVRCHPEEEALAYGVAITLLRGLLAAAPETLPRLARHTRSELSRLLPEVSDLDRPATGDDPGAEARLFAAVRDVIDAVGSPVLLLLDDAHWLDPASATLLAYLVRRVSDLSAVMVCAWATDVRESPGALVHAVDEVAAEGHGGRLVLRPLGAEDVGLLVAGADVDVHQVLATTGGVPALVLAYVDAARRGEDPAANASVAVRETVTRRLGTVSETTRQIVAAVAVLGGHGDLGVLRQTSGRSDDEVAAGVEEALAAGLLAELAGRDGYDVPFETMRAVILDTMTTVRRRLLHERAAEALMRLAGSRATSAQCGTVARHLNAAGRTEESAGWHWRAATEARRLHAHEEALGEVRAALALGLDSHEARIVEAETLIALGRYSDAITALELAAAGAPSAEITMQVERRLGDVHHRLGDYAVADAHLEAAAEAAAEGRECDVATILGELALVAYRRGDIGTAAAHADAGYTVAQQCGDPAAIASTTNVLGLLAARRGDHAEAERWMRTSLEHADRASDPSGAIAALNNLGRLLREKGDLGAAREAAEDALERGVRIGDRHRIAALHTNLADLLRAAGDEDASMEHLKAAAALFAEVDDARERRPEIWMLVEW
ncbi:MAG TPA: AAA family ATPase [Mycobacteriales bacterium]|nr:AAA family ATPase [Mycobacteriales bacterium]